LTSKDWTKGIAKEMPVFKKELFPHQFHDGTKEKKNYAGSENHFPY
jgi:hypothetical protein